MADSNLAIFSSARKKKLSIASSKITDAEILELEKLNDLNLEKYKKIQWIKTKTRQLRIATEYEHLKKEHLDFPPKDELLKKIAMNQETLYQEVNQQKLYQTMVQKSQLVDVLYKMIIGPFDYSVSDSELDHILTSSDRMQALKYVEKIHNLSLETMSEHKEIMDLEEDIVDKQLQLLELRQKRHGLMEKIARKKNEEKKRKESEMAVKDERITLLEEEIEKKSADVSMVSRFLHVLIAFSGLNWAKDTELRKIVIDSGKPTEKQIQSLNKKVVAEEELSESMEAA